MERLTKQCLLCMCHSNVMRLNLLINVSASFCFGFVRFQQEPKHLFSLLTMVKSIEEHHEDMQRFKVIGLFCAGEFTTANGGKLIEASVKWVFRFAIPFSQARQLS